MNFHMWVFKDFYGLFCFPRFFKKASDCHGIKMAFRAVNMHNMHVSFIFHRLVNINSKYIYVTEPQVYDKVEFSLCGTDDVHTIVFV